MIYAYLLHIKKNCLSQKAQGITEYALLLLFVIILFAIIMSPYFSLRYRMIFLQIINSIKKLVTS